MEKMAEVGNSSRFRSFILACASIKQMDDFSGSQTGFSIQNFEGKGKVG